MKNQSIFMKRAMERVFQHYDAGGKPGKETAQKFKVGRVTTYRWYDLWKANQGESA